MASENQKEKITIADLESQNAKSAAAIKEPAAVEAKITIKSDQPQSDQYLFFNVMPKVSSKTPVMVEATLKSLEREPPPAAKQSESGGMPNQPVKEASKAPSKGGKKKLLLALLIIILAAALGAGGFYYYR